jgi:hypothetical protein
MAAGRIFGDPFRVDIAQFAAMTQGRCMFKEET